MFSGFNLVASLCQLVSHSVLRFTHRPGLATTLSCFQVSLVEHLSVVVVAMLFAVLVVVKTCRHTRCACTDLCHVIVLSPRVGCSPHVVVLPLSMLYAIFFLVHCMCPIEMK